MYAAVHLTVKLPGVVEVAHETDPWSTLQVPEPEMHVWLTAGPGISAGVTEPPVTVTLIESIVVVAPSMGAGRPSAQQLTGTVAPAGTSPGGGDTDAVTTASPKAVAGKSPAMSATDAYTCPGILMVNPVLQGVSLDKGEW